MYAVETINIAYFIDIGGLTAVDMNFKVNSEGNFPLLIASAKGRYYLPTIHPQI